jgi:putative ABC transport system substrate-binding protein
VRRRAFITLLGGAVAWPLAARAQQSERVRRVGVLMVVAETDPDAKRLIEALETRLDAAGWHKGRKRQPTRSTSWSHSAWLHLPRLRKAAHATAR